MASWFGHKTRPVFEIANGGVVPFLSVAAGPDLYESEVEQLLWDNLEDLIGAPLFPVKRQAQIAGGGRPDIVALAPDGNVFVVEVKRDVDRSQLAQCLEYAGWARRTNLDELASLYHGGPSAFFSDWQQFTDSTVPVVVGRYPKLVLAARDFDGRTASALEFLQGYDLPVRLLRIALYEDSSGHRLVDVQRDSGPDQQLPRPLPAPRLGSCRESPSVSSTARPSMSKQSFGATLMDLLHAGLISPGEPLEWTRPQLGETYRATITEDGGVQLPDGRRYASPSTAGTNAAGVPSLNGWIPWRCRACKIGPWTSFARSFCRRRVSTRSDLVVPWNSWPLDMALANPPLS